MMASGPSGNKSIIIKGDNFRQFDVVTDYSDHHFKTGQENNQYFFNYAGTEVYKKVMKEWKILEKSLPESIFVRVYEGRIDLLRALIIGARGTPYQDALFFFDIAFPYDYPNNPPLVYYHSHGLRLNPNLYENGNVCLSLLNTWTGKQDEMWNPSASTMLQVLVSLQGLVLNEKPIYNEPYMLLHRWFSKGYNEKAFKLSCHTMVYFIRKPPLNFQNFVAWHFRERGKAILGACKAYRDGCGHVADDGLLLPPGTIKVSGNFKAELEMLYKVLFQTFSKIGVSLEDTVKDLESVKIEKQNKHETQSKIVCIIRSIFGFKDGKKLNDSAAVSN